LRSAVGSAETLFRKNLADDPDLGFLGEVSLFTAPLKIAGIDLGIAAIGFNTARDDIRRIFPVAASMIAQTLRIERAVRGQRQKLIDENWHLRRELKGKYEFSHIIGNSAPMKQVYELVTQVARSNATVLLRG